MVTISNPGDSNLKPNLFIPRRSDLLSLRDINTNFLAIQQWADIVRAVSAAGGLRFATRVIAAHDSLDTNKDHADYVCTGANDEIIVNQAVIDVNADSALGGSVELMDGHFNFHGTGAGTACVDLYQNTWIRGQGFATSITFDNTTVAGSTMLASNAPATKQNTISDLIMDGNKAHVSGGIGYRASGLVAQDTNTTFRNLFVQNFDSAGIQLVSLTAGIQCNIVDNFFLDNTHDVWLERCDKVTVSRNQSNGSVIFCYVPVLCSRLNICDNNVLQSGSSTAIYLNCDHSLIDGNTISGSTTGIYSLDGVQSAYQNNEIDGCTQGIWVDTTTREGAIRNNEILNCTGDHIIIGGSTTRMMVFGNQCRSPGNSAVNNAGTNTRIVCNDFHPVGVAWGTAAIVDTGAGTIFGFTGAPPPPAGTSFRMGPQWTR